MNDASPVPPLLLASTSPQRRAILTQLGIAFEVKPPRYEEHDEPGLRPSELVRAHAHGKAVSLLDEAAGCPVLGVDTTVVLDGKVYGKPADASEASDMLDALAGRTHEVVSGLCLLTDFWEELHHVTTQVKFRQLTAREIATALATEEWQGRAGAYAIQGHGATLVERIEGDYLNVVGLPAACLVEVLARRFSGL